MGGGELMSMFGLELRKVGNIKNLYRDVDIVLGNTNRANLQRQTVAHAIQKMMKSDKWFDVTCIKGCAKVCEICIPEERMDIYSAIHCIHWNEMLPDYRQQIIAMVLDDFRSILDAA